MAGQPASPAPNAAAQAAKGSTAPNKKRGKKDTPPPTDGGDLEPPSPAPLLQNKVNAQEMADHPSPAAGAIAEKSGGKRTRSAAGGRSGKKKATAVEETADGITPVASPGGGRKRVRTSEEQPEDATTGAGTMAAPKTGAAKGKTRRARGATSKTVVVEEHAVLAVTVVQHEGETVAVAAATVEDMRIEEEEMQEEDAAMDKEAEANKGKGKKKAAPAKSRSRKIKEKPPPLPVYSYTMRPAPLEPQGFRVVGWNVAGLRALLKKNPTALSELVGSERADVLCLQEVKVGSDVDKEALQEQMGLQGWYWHWCCGDTKGYSGVATASRAKPLRVWSDLDIAEHDKEGRVVTAEFDDVYVVNVYVPNSGDGLRRLDYRVKSWDLALSSYIKGLEASKPVILTGDMNCAAQEIDIHAPKTNLRSAGFTQEERDSFASCYLQRGLLDSWREQHPGVVGYTYWTYKFNCRAKNKGWRLDYFLVSQGLKERIHDSYIKYDIMGSDHCPIGLILKP